MSKEYFTLHFDAQGHALYYSEQEAIVTALLATDKPVTDLWIFAHGWNTDEAKADSTYNVWVSRMQERIRQEITDTLYHPAFVGIYWPSKAWVEDVARKQHFPPDTSGTGAAYDMSPGEFEIDAHKFEIDFAHVEGELELGEEETTSEVDYRARFIEACLSVIDPLSSYSNRSFQHAARLYSILFQTEQPAPDIVKEFVQILYHYITEDPHQEVFETPNVLDSPEVLVNYLDEEITQEGFSSDNPLLDVFRAFTFWTMKGRAAIVGQNGVAPFLRDIKKTLRQRTGSVRLHLLGHSFGAKLVSASVHALAQLLDGEPPLVDTLILLLGAFSQFSFSSRIPIRHGGAGRYADLIKHRLVASPIAVIYSQYDLANKELYPFGMRFANRARVYEIGGPDDRFGAIGANGAQGLDGTTASAIDMLPLNLFYDQSTFKDFSCLNINGQSYIIEGKEKRPAGAHGDTGKAEIFHLALAISRSDHYSTARSREEIV